MPASGLPQLWKTGNNSKFVKSKHAQKGRRGKEELAASASVLAAVLAARQCADESPAKAASGAGKYKGVAGQRYKIRMKGLFGLRHWIRPEHKDAFSEQMMEITDRFRGK